MAWRVIDGWPMYEVSSEGEVKGIRSGKLLKGGGCNFPVVLLQNFGESQLISRARLVAAAFIGECPVSCFVGHKDGDKWNCKLSNLYFESKYKEGEEWRVVDGWPYEVSDKGRVRRITGAWEEPLYLAAYDTPPSGHKQVVLTRENEKKSKCVHVLVAAAFIGKRPDTLVVNHKDGNPRNNVPANLEYVTRAENNKHAGQMGLLRYGERHANAKLKEAEVKRMKEIRRTRKLSYSQLATMFGVSCSHVSNIINGKVWRRVE